MTSGLTGADILTMLYNVLLNRVPAPAEVEGHLRERQDLSPSEVLLNRLPVFMGAAERLQKVETQPVFDLKWDWDAGTVAGVLALLAASPGRETLDILFLEAEIRHACGEGGAARPLYRKLLLDDPAQWHHLSPTRLSQAIVANQRLVGFGDTDRASAAALQRLYRRRRIAVTSAGIMEHDRKFVTRKDLTASSLLTYRSALLQSEEILSDALADHLVRTIHTLPQDEAATVLRALLLLRGISGTAAENFIKAFQHIHDFTGLGDRAATPLARDAAIINVCGFSFTGSSAIFDFLNGIDDLASLTDDGLDIEIPLVVHFRNLLAARTPPSPVNLAKAFFWQLLNIFVAKDALHELNLKRTSFNFFARAALNYGSINLEDYSRAVLELMRDLSQEFGLSSKVSMTNFLSRCADPSGKGTYKYYLYSQAPQALSIQGAEILADGAIFIVSHRDPRDQFLDLVRHGLLKNTLEAAQKFIETFNANALRYESAKSEYQHKHQFIDIQFERFILDIDYRRALTDRLGISFPDTTPYFNPEISQKNIAAHREAKNRPPIELIESRLSAYLFDLEIPQPG